METRFDFVGFLMALGVILIVIIILLFTLIPVKMAKKRGRSQVGWGIVGFISTFSVILYIFVLIILACLGETDERRRQRIEEEEDWRRNL